MFLKTNLKSNSKQFYKILPLLDRTVKRDRKCREGHAARVQPDQSSLGFTAQGTKGHVVRNLTIQLSSSKRIELIKLPY